MSIALFLGALVVGALAPAGMLWVWRGSYPVAARIIAAACVIGVVCGYLPNTFWLCIAMALAIAGLVLTGYLGVSGDDRKRFALVVLMMGVVAGLSGQAGGAAPFRDFLSNQMHLPPATVDTITYFGRKSVHVVAYATLAISVFRFQIKGGSALWPVLACALWWQVVTASGDELRQSFTPGRTGLFSDVVLDTVAGSSGLLVIAAIMGWRSKHGRS